MVAIGDPYIQLTDLKRYLSMEDDSRFDAELNGAIQSATKEINRMCNRQFGKADTPSWRSFKILYPGYVSVADFWDTPTEIQVSRTPDGAGTVAAAGSYVLEPLDGIVDEEPGWPRWIVKPSAVGGLSLVPGMYLRMNSSWGWPAVPADVIQASKIIAGATFQIKDAPFGVAGSDQWGTIRVRDNQMAITKLNRLAKDRILVG